MLHATLLPAPDTPASATGADSTPGISVSASETCDKPTRRPWALQILVAIAVVLALDAAQSFFIPLLLGILFAYTLNPLVVWLQRCGISRRFGSGGVMLVVFCLLVTCSYALRGQVQTILEQLPAAASRLSSGLASLRKDQADTMEKLQAAASTIEKATTGIAPPSRQQAARLVLDRPWFRLGDFLWAGSLGIADLLGQATMVLFLTYFLLLSGTSYRRKLVRLTGPGLSHKKITVRILDDINASIQRYMLMLLSTNVLLALLTWMALSWLGLDNAGAWAVAAGLLHLIPYLGPLVSAVAIGMAVLMQFDSATTALLAAATTLIIATLVGILITTWMTGKIGRINAAAVFIDMLFWAWLWGIWGMLLSIPILVIAKVVAQHVAPHGMLAELLGDDAANGPGGKSGSVPYPQ